MRAHQPHNARLAVQKSFKIMIQKWEKNALKTNENPGTPATKIDQKLPLGSSGMHHRENLNHQNRKKSTLRPKFESSSVNNIRLTGWGVPEALNK